MNFDYCEGKVHVIREGDSLYKISKMYEVPLALIMRANPYVDVYNLKVGEEVCIPVVMERPQPPMRPERPQPPMRPERPQPPMNPERPVRPITMPGLGNVGMENILTYVVKDEDTLEDLLDYFDIDLEDLLKFNTSGKIWLKPGETIRIPERIEQE